MVAPLGAAGADGDDGDVLEDRAGVVVARHPVSHGIGFLPTHYSYVEVGVLSINTKSIVHGARLQ